MSLNLMFHYNYNGLCEYSLNTINCGPKSGYNSFFGPCVWEGADLCFATYISFNIFFQPSNKDLNQIIKNITATISVTDGTDPDNPNTVGILQFVFQNFQPATNAEPKTYVPKVTCSVTVATGIFASYLNHTVTMDFDNVTGNRTILISS